MDANQDVVFDVFSNFENYENVSPQHFPSIRICSTRNNASIVEEHLNLGDVELLIMAKHVSVRPTLHEVFVIGGDIKGSHIKERFIKVQQGTKILIDVDLNLGWKMNISSLFQANFKQDYDVILKDFVKAVKG